MYMRIIDRVKHEAYNNNNNNNNNNAFVAESFPKKFNIFISTLTSRTSGIGLETTSQTVA